LRFLSARAAQKAPSDSEVDVALDVKSAGGGDTSAGYRLFCVGGGALSLVHGAFSVAGRGKKVSAMTLSA
jgi:hypothetical protein